MVEQLDELRNTDRSLFPSNFAIRALRDSRYHNAAYAIAELIDNAIEASAEQIELLCMERYDLVHSRRARIDALAVLDNGTGMDAPTLVQALRFGGGTRHDSIRGIGKYGMGLPTSSMSQCKCVNVWTWQYGIDSVWHCSLDANRIEQGDHDVPVPDQTTPIPAIWREAGSDAIFSSPSGTLVEWSDMDKLQWRTGRAIIDNTSREVGRIHRHFINADITRIRAKAFLNDRPSESTYESHIVANDPIYLMTDTSTPSPWNNEAMFTEWMPPKFYPVPVGDKEATVEVRYSIVKPEALMTDMPTQNPGDTPRGRHARHNIGVSVVREDREIVLEDAFLREGGSADNPQNRWWGCEVHFRRDCDEVFGVDHNKQMVANFTQAARTLARDDRPNQVILDELGIQDDDIHRIVSDIRDQTRAMMRQIRQMFEQKRSKPRRDNTRPTPENKAVNVATEADRFAIEHGVEEPTATDIARQQVPADEREQGLTQQFVDDGRPRDSAQELAKTLIEEDLHYQFNPTQLDGYQIFSVRSSHGVLHINLNTEHPIYDLLRHVEGDLGDSLNEDEPAYQVVVALRLLLSSWARMEDQTESREERMRIQNIAMTWGRQVDKVISYLRDRTG